MGYIILLVVGAVLLVVFAVGAGRTQKAKTGRISSKGDAILREKPSADEPTPARSVTASPAEVRRAEKATPPA
jgi:hypothetical protein